MAVQTAESDQELFLMIVDAVRCIGDVAPVVPEKLSRENIELLMEWAGDLLHATSHLGARLSGEDREQRLECLRAA